MGHQPKFRRITPRDIQKEAFLHLVDYENRLFDVGTYVLLELQKFRDGLSSKGKDGGSSVSGGDGRSPGRARRNTLYTVGMGSSVKRTATGMTRALQRTNSAKMKRILLAIIGLVVVSLPLNADLTVTFVDVGQGDAEYIVLPNGKTVLVDGGPSNTDMAAFITSKGITTIDYVVLTHPHSDHYQGLNYVFDNCQVNNFYDTRMNNTGATGDETVRNKALSEPGCGVYYPASGDTLSWDPEVAVKVLRGLPGVASSSDGTAINTCSIVLKLTYKGTSILLTGDIDSTVESSLVSTYGNDLAAAVLKVAHHGSAYGSSAAFLDKVRPSRAYIGVGAGNSYGHPTADALSRLLAAGATIYRTDQSGTLTYTIASNTTSNDNTGTTNTSSAASVKESDYVKPAQVNFGATSGIKKKIKELKNYKDAQK